MAEGAPRRRWGRGVLLAVLAVALVALAFAFGAANGPQPIRITFGVAAWSGEAVHALFGAVLLGLLVMFLVGLSTDLAARAERRGLERQVREMERELVTLRAAQRPAAQRPAAQRPAPEPAPGAPNPTEAGPV